MPDRTPETTYLQAAERPVYHGAVLRCLRHWLMVGGVFGFLASSVDNCRIKGDVPAGSEAAQGATTADDFAARLDTLLADAIIPTDDTGKWDEVLHNLWWHFERYNPVRGDEGMAPVPADFVGWL